MSYFRFSLIFLLLISFSIISFATEELEKEMLKKAEAGDKQAILQLIDFYKENGNVEQAEIFLEKAAKAGDIPSLREVYQKTGRIILTGVDVAVRDQIFVSHLGEDAQIRVDFLKEYLSSPERVRDKPTVRSVVMNEITQGTPSGDRGNIGSGSSSSSGNETVASLSNKCMDGF